MNKSEIIIRLRYLIKHYYKLNLNDIYYKSISVDDINKIVPYNIYILYKKELNCIYFETIIGDGSYDEIIKYDFIFAIKEVLKYLNTYLDI